MSKKIKLTFEVEIYGDDEARREKVSSVMIANISDIVRRTVKRLNFWSSSSSYEKVKYELNIKTERLDK